jgi:hypothetical protein
MKIILINNNYDYYILFDFDAPHRTFYESAMFFSSKFMIYLIQLQNAG